MDIVRDKDFKSANHTLDGMLKEMTKTGESRATNHKPVIHPEDLEQRISSYFLSAPYNPLFLVSLVYTSCYAWIRVPPSTANRLVSFSKGWEQSPVCNSLPRNTTEKLPGGIFDQKKLYLERESMRFLRVRSVQLKCYVCFSLRQTAVLLVCSTLVSKMHCIILVQISGTHQNL